MVILCFFFLKNIDTELQQSECTVFYRGVRRTLSNILSSKIWSNIFKGKLTKKYDKELVNVLCFYGHYFVRKLRRHFTKNEVFHFHFFSKCEQIHSFLQIWSHLLKKSLMENFIFCAVRHASNQFASANIPD